MIKAFIILVLAVAVFGAGAYWTFELYLRPHQELKEEKLLPPEPAPPDPTIEDFEKCVAIQKSMHVLEARTAFEQFIEQNPQSTKLEEAKDHLGELNTRVFLSPIPAPEKQEYVVRSGDVLNKVATRMKSTPELIARSNDLRPNRTGNIILQIGQKLLVSPGEFSVSVNKRSKKVVVLNRGKFFKQYPILSLPLHHATPGKKGAPANPAVQKLAGKVTEKIAWSPAGLRINVTDKEYGQATHWIAFNVPGNTLYSEVEPGSGVTAPKPPSGIGMMPEHMEELAALLRKGDPATIQQ